MTTTPAAPRRSRIYTACPSRYCVRLIPPGEPCPSCGRQLSAEEGSADVR